MLLYVVCVYMFVCAGCVLTTYVIIVHVYYDYLSLISFICVITCASGIGNVPSKLCAAVSIEKMLNEQTITWPLLS